MTTIASPPRPTRAPPVRSAHPSGRRCEAVGHYTDAGGRPREVIATTGAAGSVLVIDRDAFTTGDRRLVAHLGADEGPSNAALIGCLYVQDPRRGRCRAVRREDFRVVPFPDLPQDGSPSTTNGLESLPGDARGNTFRLELVNTGMSIPELRWRMHSPPQPATPARLVSTREAIGRLEGYEPVCGLTRSGLARHARDHSVSTAVLAVELTRALRSPIVLNRALREAVLAAIERDDLSMSEIAIRCGRIKRDHNGNQSGETSWLGRRIGLLPEGGRCASTPWIHSDVLALIARAGLGVSPREVELVAD